MNKKLKSVTAIAALCCMAMSNMTYAADVNLLNVKNCTEDIKTILNEDTAVKAIPDEIFKYHNELGHTVTIKDKLIVNGNEAHGVYYNGGTEDGNIYMSLKTVNDGFPNMLPFYFTHELGHFVYFHGNFSEEDNAVLENYYNRFNGYNFSITGKEEAFAELYAQVKDRGATYGITQEEVDMITRVEQSVVDRYLNEGQNGPGISSNYHYRGNWELVGDKWMYKENDEYLKDTWALIYNKGNADNMQGYRMWYHFDTNGIMDAESETEPA